MSKANLRSFLTLSPLALALGVLGGCGGESASSDSGSTSDANGTLSLGITDAPVDGATAVWVSFSGVAIQPENGERIEWSFDSRREINLLDLQGTLSHALVTNEPVPAGRYEWIRLLQPEAEITFADTGDASYEMFIPSGEQTGLKLQRGFTVPAGGEASYTIDFDLRRAVVHRSGNAPGGEYILKPAHRLVDNTEVGTIEGTVDPMLAGAEDCVPAAYLFTDADATPDDLGSASATEPLTSAGIELREAEGNGPEEYAFTMGFVPAGEYTVAWTCEADTDDPEADDDISFETSKAVTVEAGKTVNVGL